MLSSLSKIELNSKNRRSWKGRLYEDILFEYKILTKLILNGFVGQKTAVILTLLLSHGTKPLIIDQPEDDLDNRLIYDLVVHQMCHSEEFRQIIVITHNANISVNVDSEHIVAL